MTITTFEVIPKEIWQYFFYEFPHDTQQIFPLVCKAWNELTLEIRVRWDDHAVLKYAKQSLQENSLPLKVQKLYEDVLTDPLIPDFFKLITKENLSDYSKYSFPNTIEFPIHSEILNLKVNCFEFYKTIDEGIKFTWLKKRTLRKSKHYSSDLMIKVLVYEYSIFKKPVSELFNFQIPTRDSQEDPFLKSIAINDPKDPTQVIYKKAQVHLLNDKNPIPPKIMAKLSFALRLQIEKCAFYNINMLKHIKLHELQDYPISCDAYGKICNEKYSFKIVTSSTHLSSDKNFTTLVWEDTTKFISKVTFTGPMAIRYGVISRTVQMLSAKLKLEKIEFPSFKIKR